MDKILLIILNSPKNKNRNNKNRNVNNNNDNIIVNLQNDLSIYKKYITYCNHFE